MNATPLLDFIGTTVEDSIATKRRLLALAPEIARAAELLVETYRGGGKAIFFGNGGSAADSQHLAAELVGRFYVNRAPLDALSLTVNSSILTAVGNDFGYDQVFLRQLEAVSKPGDLAIGISTSGTSKNVLLAARRCRDLGLRLITLSGERETELTGLADVALRVPSADTPRIQECHILIGHTLCDWLERSLFDANGGAR